ncbi:hypothetical protein K402DRAFT_163599 [Aulographum hederae CBS 113979]|uniref:Uncharacterized protein n=1 Tax=Aulographum hederae CBS 113979 TaxID=1176131 RepID=A0A6G1GS02_9PEZI|nr:hypothetical protein K402DRAFT_163599 [Aulographum hederae CBS 113979]
MILPQYGNPQHHFCIYIFLFVSLFHASVSFQCPLFSSLVLQGSLSSVSQLISFDKEPSLFRNSRTLQSWPTSICLPCNEGQKDADGSDSDGNAPNDDIAADILVHDLHQGFVAKADFLKVSMSNYV